MLSIKRSLFTCLALPILIGSGFCKEKPHGIILVLTFHHFHGAGARIERGGKEIPTVLGMRLLDGDVIHTGDAYIDMQSNTGVSVRVREFTRMEIGSLRAGVEAPLRFELAKGSMMGRTFPGVFKGVVEVRTPTAVASVRGTSFLVEVQAQGLKPRVKVLEGKVAMRPRVPALEEFSPAEIKRSETLSELSNKMAQQERVIEESTAAVLDEKAEQEVLQIQDKLESAKKGGLRSEQIEVIKTAEVVREKKNIVIEKSAVTAREQAEQGTLLAVEKTLIERTGPEADPELSRQIVDDYREKTEKALQEIERKARERRLRSERELLEHYGLIEIVTLNNGEVIRGAVVAHSGRIMIMHTADGTRRLNESEVNFVRYRTR